jgi:hypothetical protein
VRKFRKKKKKMKMKMKMMKKFAIFFFFQTVVGCRWSAHRDRESGASGLDSAERQQAEQERVNEHELEELQLCLSKWLPSG